MFITFVIPKSTVIFNHHPMKTRIQSIIDHYRLTPSRFADQIGVQRSAVSHILSGRNNPGLDFLAKILDNYAEISGDWLITGKGEMLKKKSAKPLFEPNLFTSSTHISNEPEDQATYKRAELPKLNKPEPPSEPVSTPEIKPSVTATPLDKRISRIVIFYDDHSFESYQSE